MNFWGVEVKSGEPLKVQPQFGKLIHISQAALGEVKDVEGAKHVPLRLKIDDKNLFLGALSAEEITQLMFDLVFEREFELSHDWKNGSVYFMGYMANDPVSEEEDFSDDFEDEPIYALQNGNIKQKLGDVKDAKTAATTKGNKKEEQPVSDEDEDDSESYSHDELAFGKLAQEDFGDFSEEDSEDDMDGSFSSEEELPKKEQQTKKRSADSPQEAPVFNKKAKTSTPNNTGNKKTVDGPDDPLDSRAPPHTSATPSRRRIDVEIDEIKPRLTRMELNQLAFYRHMGFEPPLPPPQQ